MILDKNLALLTMHNRMYEKVTQNQIIGRIKNIQPHCLRSDLYSIAT